MFSQYNSSTQPLSSSSQPQVTPSYPQQAAYLASATHSGMSERLTPPLLQPRRGSHLIGRPIFFTSGPFQGRTIRMELEEIQQAQLGRKYARVDRRPLDPPPVVLLRMFELARSGTDAEEEIEIESDSDVQVLGLLCTVDLFPVPDPESVTAMNCDPSPSAASTPPSQTIFYSSPSPSSPHSHSPRGAHVYQSYTSELPFSFPEPGSRMRSFSNQFSGYIMPSEEAPDIVYRLDGFPIAESSKQTTALVGATFVQPVVMEYRGKKGIMFVFADLAVKIEGHFILRYRVFDIFGRPFIDSSDLAISAECYGGKFRVYSTKEFPGLPASTELTKRLSLYGVRLNIRVNERRRRKAQNSEGNSSPLSTYDDEQ